ncbi:MAG TPA: hypothetical protein PLB74_02170 [Candidatus Paceibacterota bacterium]|nr:hypothetical protein [Candidatus Paceibacterota bacterium]
MDDKSIVKKDQTLPSTDFSKFENYLTELGLPIDNIIASPEERIRIMTALPEFVNSLPVEVKRNARYLSKFIAGSAVGLFDAALNYVWNEVVLSLRKIIVIYGLDIFYDSAVGEKQRDQYGTEEDLSGLRDKTLLDNCYKLELISEIVYKKLSHILDMRNDIGASHPTTYSINSYELLGWLQTCINDILKNEPSSSAITIKSIIDNLKRGKSLLEKGTIESFEHSIKDISTDMTGNLLTTLFGLFVSNGTDALLRKNITSLLPIVWDHSKDEKKFDLGFKLDTYKSNLDEDKISLAESFFEICDGNRYLSSDTRIIKLNNLCEDLERTHYEWDNFHHEPPIAKSILSYIKKHEDIPKERQEKLIRTMLICRIGREVDYRNGVSPGAKPFYDKFFEMLSKEQVILLLNIIQEPTIRDNLSGNIRGSNTKELLTIIKNPVLGQRINEIIDFLLKQKKLDIAFRIKDFKDLAKGIL